MNGNVSVFDHCWTLLLAAETFGYDGLYWEVSNLNGCKEIISKDETGRVVKSYQIGDTYPIYDIDAKLMSLRIPDEHTGIKDDKRNYDIVKNLLVNAEVDDTGCKRYSCKVKGVGIVTLRSDDIMDPVCINIGNGYTSICGTIFPDGSAGFYRAGTCNDVLNTVFNSLMRKNK